MITKRCVEIKFLGNTNEIFEVPDTGADLLGARHFNRRTHFKAHRLREILCA